LHEENSYLLLKISSSSSKIFQKADKEKFNITAINLYLEDQEGSQQHILNP